jgi:hypothetical protein
LRTLSVTLRLLAALTSAALITGCASFEKTKPAPSVGQTIAVDVTAEELSGWTDLPTGTYRVPNSQVIVSGHQKGGAAGVLFGVLGVMVQGAINSSIGAQSVKDVEDALRIDLTASAGEATRELIASGRFGTAFSSAPESASAVLTVNTALIATYVSDTDVRPYVLLKASLRDANAKDAKWSTRYIASLGDARPLVGEGGWTSDGGQPLRSVVQANLRRAVEVMLADVASPYARDDQRLTTVQGGFPFVKQRLQTVGYQLAEDDASIVFIPKLGDVLVFAGVNVMDKAVTTYHPAAKDDSPFKVVE